MGSIRRRLVSLQSSRKGQVGVWQLLMLALGAAVGGSFFLSTAISLRAAGVATLIAFVVGGILVYLILMALSEMTVSRPAHGSFREYAEVAFGPAAGFVVGWVYWTGLVLALSSETTAIGLFVRLWSPTFPLWLVSLAVVVSATALNLLDVRYFSAAESLMAGIKILAIIAFIILMLAVLLGLLPGRPPVLAFRSEPFMPAGLGGLAGSMLVVLFSYAGFEVLGLAAPDAKDPGRTVPRAIILTVLTLVILYIGAVAVILPVLPYSALRGEVSPLILAVQAVGMPGLSSGLNLIIMSASLSTILAGMFALSRMLYSLAEEGQAPAIFRHLTPAGAPRRALFASAGSMLVGVVLAYLLPKQVYLFLVSSGGFSLLFAYLAILASQLVIRRREGCPATGCQLPFYPYSTWLGIVLLIGAILAMPLVPGQGAGLVAGVAMTLLFTGFYFVRGWRANRSRSSV